MITTADHPATTDNRQQWTNHQPMGTNNTRRTNPHNPTNPDQEQQELTALPIPTQPVTDAISDNYINPWGDHMEIPKPSETVRICLQNFGGWPKSIKNQKMIISASLLTWRR